MIENIYFDKRDLKYCGKNVIIGKTGSSNFVVDSP